MITASELKSLEKYLDGVWAKLNIDIEFSKHFIERANDERNKKPIEVEELKKLFMDVYKKYGKKFSNMKLNDDEIEGILTDLSTKINSPFVMRWDRKTKEFELVSKTVMRKDKFVSNNPTKEKRYTVEELQMTQVSELIESLAEKNVVESSKILHSIMLDRVALAISEKKMDVVANMFESKDEDDDDDKKKKSEDDDDDDDDKEDDKKKFNFMKKKEDQNKKIDESVSSAELAKLEKEYDKLQDIMDKVTDKGGNYKNTSTYKKSQEIYNKIKAARQDK